MADNDENSSGGERLTVEFLNVGMGDCTFIRYKDVQILVDSGEFEADSEQGLMNADKIFEHIKGSFGENDKTLDYVIVTHGDSDHLGNMGKILNKFDNILYSVGTIIDFDSLYYEAFYQAKYHPDQYEKNKSFFDSKCNKSSDSDAADADAGESYFDDKISEYKKSRDRLIKTSTKYYCVAERMNDKVKYTPIFDNDAKAENITNGNSKFNIGGDSEPILQILFNENYFDLLDSSSMTKEMQGTYSKYAYYVNSKSVCAMITYGKSKVLLTGDLEETNDMYGETNLVKTYTKIDEEFLKNVTLYKAAHHGSKTSNSKEFLKVIKPKYVAISALANSAGNSSGGYWNFPRQEILENLLAITNDVYITAFLDESGNKDSYYGNIKFDINDKEEVDVSSSVEGDKDYNSVYNEDGELKKLFDTDWFRDNRYLPLNVYVFSGYQSQTKAYWGNCVLVKYGANEILIDCGVWCQNADDTFSDIYIKKLEDYCLDGKIECVIVTSPYSYSIQQMVDVGSGENIRKGIFSLYEIETLIDYGLSSDPSRGAERSLYKKYNESKAQLKKNTKIYSASQKQNEPIELAENLSLNILKNPAYDIITDDGEGAVCCYVEFYGKKLLFMGNVSKKGESAIINESANDFSNTILFNAVDFGYSGANSNELLQKIKSKERLYITVNSIAGSNFIGKKNLTRALCDRLINLSEFCYLTMDQSSDGKFREISGDITFSIKTKNGKIDGNPSLTGSKSTILLQKTEFYKNLKIDD